DLRKEQLAVREARRLGLPIVALVDTNCDPDEADYVIPGNDDAIRACDLIVRVVADGIAAGQQKATPADFKRPAATNGAGSDAPMMDCKRALQETNGDIEAAVRLLREKGMAGAAKRAERETPEGKVGYRLAEDNRRGSMVAVGCETEPVSNNDEFLAFAKKVLEVVEANGPGAEHKLEEERAQLSGKLGENITVAGTTRFEAVNGARISAYAHPPRNKIGVLLQLRGGSDDLARKVAMHIAAMRPRWIGRDDVPESDVVQEREIFLGSDEVQSKPEQ